MFTRMSKGVLWVLVAAVVIGGFVGMAEEVGIGLLIWLGGLVLIWGLGVFVELINNILDIRKILQSISSTGSMGSSNVGTYGSMGYNMNTSTRSGWNETTWYCNHYGTPNSSDATRCAGCGTQRPNSGKPSLASAAAQMGNSRETQTDGTADIVVQRIMRHQGFVLGVVKINKKLKSSDPVIAG